MDWYWIVWTYSVLNPVAAGLIAWRSKSGFIVGQAAAALMVAHGVAIPEVRGLALMGAVYFAINCGGLVKWRDQPWWRKKDETPSQQVVVISGSGGCDGHPDIAVDGKGRLNSVRPFPGSESRGRRNAGRTGER